MNVLETRNLKVRLLARPPTKYSVMYICEQTVMTCKKHLLLHGNEVQTTMECFLSLVCKPSEWTHLACDQATCTINLS